ncbi:MAG TPA: hypothetical protein VGA56_24910 [Opitutaceae bacterium]
MPSPGRKAFLIRIDPSLWLELEGWAQQELRSVNGQIEFLLREAVSRRRRAAAKGEGNSPGDTSAPGGPVS